MTPETTGITPLRAFVASLPTINLSIQSNGNHVECDLARESAATMSSEVVLESGAVDSGEVVIHGYGPESMAC